MGAASQGVITMNDVKATSTTFCQGDEIVLVHGSYQGTIGIFFRLKADNQWADITERNGKIRSHPVAWLAHAEQHVASEGPAAVFPAQKRLTIRECAPST